MIMLSGDKRVLSLMVTVFGMTSKRSQQHLANPQSQASARDGEAFEVQWMVLGKFLHGLVCLSMAALHLKTLYCQSIKYLAHAVSCAIAVVSTIAVLSVVKHLTFYAQRCTCFSILQQPLLCTHPFSYDTVVSKLRHHHGQTTLTYLSTSWVMNPQRLVHLRGQSVDLHYNK